MSSTTCACIKTFQKQWHKKRIQRSNFLIQFLDCFCLINNRAGHFKMNIFKNPKRELKSNKEENNSKEKNNSKDSYKQLKFEVRNPIWRIKNF